MKHFSCRSHHPTKRLMSESRRARELIDSWQSHSCVGLHGVASSNDPGRIVRPLLDAATRGEGAQDGDAGGCYHDGLARIADGVCDKFVDRFKIINFLILICACQALATLSVSGCSGTARSAPSGRWACWQRRVRMSVAPGMFSARAGEFEDVGRRRLCSRPSTVPEPTNMPWSRK